MGNTCTICKSKHREEIDLALVNGEPLRRIAENFGMSTSALVRHKGAHLSEAIMKAKEVQDMMQGDRLVVQMQSLNARTLKILKDAEEKQDGNLALKAISEVRKNMELAAKLEGELGRQRTITISQPQVDEYTLAWLRGDIQDIELNPDPDDGDGGNKGKK
jgi:hypothetical protein